MLPGLDLVGERDRRDLARRRGEARAGSPAPASGRRGARGRGGRRRLTRRGGSACRRGGRASPTRSARTQRSHSARTPSRAIVDAGAACIATRPGCARTSATSCSSSAGSTSADARRPFDRERRERGPQRGDLGGSQCSRQLALVGAVAEQRARATAPSTATSAPGRTGTCTSASAAVSVRRGSSTHTRPPPAAVLAEVADRVGQRGAVAVGDDRVGADEDRDAGRRRVPHRVEHRLAGDELGGDEHRRVVDRDRGENERLPIDGSHWLGRRSGRRRRRRDRWRGRARPRRVRGRRSMAVEPRRRGRSSSSSHADVAPSQPRAVEPVRARGATRRARAPWSTCTRATPGGRRRRGPARTRRRRPSRRSRTRPRRSGSRRGAPAPRHDPTAGTMAPRVDEGVGVGGRPVPVTGRGGPPGILGAG